MEQCSLEANRGNIEGTLPFLVRRENCLGRDLMELIVVVGTIKIIVLFKKRGKIGWIPSSSCCVVMWILERRDDVHIRYEQTKKQAVFCPRLKVSFLEEASTYSTTL